MVSNSRLAAYYEKYTCPPKSGTEQHWQDKLTELDENLFLRRSVLYPQWTIFYCHNGRLSAIAKVDRVGDFPKVVYHQLPQNSALSRKELYNLWKASQEHYEREVKSKIHDAGQQFGRDFEMMMNRRLTSSG